MRQLPIVDIKGKMFYQDDRLKEFRAVDNPHERVTYKGFFVKPIEEVIDNVAQDMKNNLGNRERIVDNISFLQGELVKRGLI